MYDKWEKREVLGMEVDSDDFYDYYEDALEDDEITPEEEGFIHGYNSAC
ncbi:hypothetical protein HYY74_06005 [Candidatus Woesearchaeota archaeon]|nr:hypothetical protein [Candidatus Woesearchaeota archaeon]